MSREPTDQDLETRDAVVAHIAEHGFPPSMQELGRLLGVTSTSTVTIRLLQAEAAGLIERVPGQPRAIRVKETT